MEIAATLARLGTPPDGGWFLPLAGGVSFDIWKVDGGGRDVYVMRARPRLAVAAEQEVPVERNHCLPVVPARRPCRAAGGPPGLSSSGPSATATTEGLVASTRATGPHVQVVADADVDTVADAPRDCEAAVRGPTPSS